MEELIGLTDWERRDHNSLTNDWRLPYKIWEFLIFRRNGASDPKTNVKNYLCPVLVLNTKFVHLNRNAIY